MMVKFKISKDGNEKKYIPLIRKTDQENDEPLPLRNKGMLM